MSVTRGRIYVKRLFPGRTKHNVNSLELVKRRAAKMVASLFSLPLELREQIYSLYFKPADRLCFSDALRHEGFFGGVYRFDFSLCRVNKQIHAEAQSVWKRENVFVKIATPWPSAGMYRVYLMSEEDGMYEDEDEASLAERVNHIASEGLVPIVCTDATADMFPCYHALVSITAPFHQAAPEHTVIVLLDDLHLFSQTWYYSALSYPMLNDRLSTTFSLLVPDCPLHLQRRLLLPFGQIKDLYAKQVNGYSRTVQLELEKGMATPIASLAECCESAADLMLQGDAMVSSDAKAALDAYMAAFKAIHILIHGRTRRVLADAFFHHPITTGRFQSQTGQSVRIVLRLQLVSRCVLAHLKLRDPWEACFWGMRTIRIIRESMDIEFQDSLSEFVGGQDVCWIHVRTGIAAWMLETAGQSVEEGSERLWAAATPFFKHKKTKADVRRELTEFGVPNHLVMQFDDDDDDNDVK
ncbi:hypothetical protein ACEQ8H_002659 [Pleosporales sp. CAS-2024a]